jgi:putative ABC transport system permease protein
MEAHVSASLDPPRFHTFLLGSFAVLALTLAAVGVFGVVSYSTSQRTRELAIRRVLGARRRDVLRLVAGRGFLPVLGGIALGLVLALVLTRVLSTMLFGIAPTDPGTYIAVGALLSAVALLACYLPSRRAMDVEPLVALRD